MDFARFVDLLASETLFFARADTFEDRFEGASGIASREAEWDSFYLDFYRKVFREGAEGPTGMSDAEVEQNARRMLASMKLSAARERHETCVSCWHANAGESEALWRLYCPGGTAGVAIETTPERVFAALDSSCQVRMGKVLYIDFRTRFAGFHDRVFWKRRSLSHEAEVRAVCTGHLEDRWGGLPVRVNVEKLCASVVPSPFAPSWFPPLLEGLIAKYGFKLNLVQSELLAQPFF